MTKLASVALLDQILERHAESLGADFTGYRNHACRVLNFAAAHATSDAETVDKLAIAAAFHDLGIWTDGTFDYLPPSERLARMWLSERGREEWAPEIAAMIRQHHKITACRGGPTVLVEIFRRADWTDISRGARAFGLPRDLLRAVFGAFPNAGFHRTLVQLTLRRLRSHPLSPLPMVRF